MRSEQAGVTFNELKLAFIGELNFKSWFIAFEKFTIQFGDGDDLIGQFHILDQPPQTLYVKSVEDFLVEVVDQGLVPLPQLGVLSQQDIIDGIVD